MIVKENTNIVQANFLIENRPKFTKDETRLYLTIIGAVNKDDTDFKPLEIPVSEFADLWGMDSSAAYRKIKTALRGLVQKEFFIEGVNQNTGKKRFLSAAYLSMAAYEEGQGYATVEISQSFKPYLIALKEKYTQYVLENIMNLTTVNAIRNYELLKQYESLGVRIFTVEEYKKALKIENKYSRNNDLWMYVVEPAVEEINQNTDILVEYEVSGRGKKSKIKFTIAKNLKTTALPEPKQEAQDEEYNPDQITIFEALEELTPEERAERENIQLFREFLKNNGKEFSDKEILEQREAARMSEFAKSLMFSVDPDMLDITLRDYIRAQEAYARARSTKEKGLHGYFVLALRDDFADFYCPKDEEEKTDRKESCLAGHNFEDFFEKT